MAHRVSTAWAIVFVALVAVCPRPAEAWHGGLGSSGKWSHATDLARGSLAMGILTGYDGHPVFGLDASYLRGLAFASVALRGNADGRVAPTVEAGLWLIACLGLGYDVVVLPDEDSLHHRLAVFVGIPVPVSPSAYRPDDGSEGPIFYLHPYWRPAYDFTSGGWSNEGGLMLKIAFPVGHR